MKHMCLMLFVIAAPMIAQAADDGLQTPVKFFPIDRSGRPVSKAAPAAPAAQSDTMRSDMSAMHDGFFRIDRQKLVPLAPQHALVITPQPTQAASAQEPRVIRGTQIAEPTPPTPPTMQHTASFSPTGGNAVLNLFNTTGNEKPSSFRDALLHGSATPTVTASEMPADNGARATAYEDQAMTRPMQNAKQQHLIVVQ